MPIVCSECKRSFEGSYEKSQIYICRFCMGESIPIQDGLLRCYEVKDEIQKTKEALKTALKWWKIRLSDKIGSNQISEQELRDFTRCSEIDAP